MFHLLYHTIKAMLDNMALSTMLPELLNANVSFLTPSKTHSMQETVNLFWYETKERELRQITPINDMMNGRAIRQCVLLQVDCNYTASACGNAPVEPEKDTHNSLGHMHNWQSRFRLDVTNSTQTCI
jgi:hypothetical protein